MSRDKKDIDLEKDKEIDEKEIEYYVNNNERRYPVLLILLTTFAVLFALGLSFSVINFLDGNQTINTIISIIKKDDEPDKPDDNNNNNNNNNNGNDKDRYIVTYVENTGPYSEKGIYLVNQFPTKDEVGKQFKGENYVFNFSLIIGKNTKGVEYELTAVPDVNNTLPEKYVKLYLEKNGEGVSFSYKPDNRVKTFADYKKSSYNETEGKLIYQGTISKNDIKNKRIDFVMRMWVSEDAPYTDEVLNKTFSVKVNTYARTSK